MRKKKKIKLIDNWHLAHRFTCMWLMGVAIVFDSASSILDSIGWRFMPQKWQSAISILLIVLAMIARLIAQKTPEPKKCGKSKRSR